MSLGAVRGVEPLWVESWVGNGGGAVDVCGAMSGSFPTTFTRTRAGLKPIWRPRVDGQRSHTRTHRTGAHRSFCLGEAIGTIVLTQDPEVLLAALSTTVMEVRAISHFSLPTTNTPPRGGQPTSPDP